MNKTSLSTMLLCIMLCIAFLPCTATAADPIRVTFISPSPRTKYPFWNDYMRFMETAAKSLSIDLTVLEATSRFDILDLGRSTLMQPEKTDYLVFIYLAQHSLSLLEMAEKVGVKSIITNTDVIPGEEARAGAPREHFSQWIGHIFPDDEQAGFRLAQRLLQKGDDLGLRSVDGTLHVIGLGGNLTSSSALYRRQGLSRAMDAHPDVHLDRFVLADWKRQIARNKTKILLEVNPMAKTIWSVNDNTAFGVLDALKNAGLKPGRDAVTGGIDWSAEGIEAVKNGEMECTLGGHFMEGAWTLVLLYDHYHGKDFKEWGCTMHSRMSLIDRGNLDTYLPALDPANWGKIDFTQFTRTHNPSIEKYDFSPDAVVRELARH